MDPPYTYLDPEGFRDFSEREGWKICTEKRIPVDPEAAWEAWFTSVWEGQTGPVMLDPGEGRGRLGSVRTVRFLGLTERIVGAGIPSPSSRPDAVPSISYTLDHATASSYLGFVRFFPSGSEAGGTRIAWCSKWTPSLAGRLFLGGHLLVRAVKTAMRRMLDDVERRATATD